jgi:hypothetical protein
LAEHIDDLTVRYEEDGQFLVEELDKEVLTRGAWTTILFRYQEMDRTSGEYGPDKFTIRRYQKKGDAYRQQSKFNISSREQARKIVETLAKWLDENAEDEAVEGRSGGADRKKSRS